MNKTILKIGGEVIEYMGSNITENESPIIIEIDNHNQKKLIIFYESDYEDMKDKTLLPAKNMHFNNGGLSIKSDKIFCKAYTLDGREAF